MTSKPNMANVSRRDLLKLAGVGAAAAILAPGCGTATGSDTAVSWQAAALNNLLPDHDFFTRWGVAPIPSISGERHVTSAGGWVWAAFTNNAAKADAGIDWVTRAFVSDAGMAAWCSIGGYLPTRQSLYDRPEYTQNPFTPTFRDHLTTFARTRPGDRKYLEVSNSLQIALSSVASGVSTADQALDQALSRLA